MLELGLPQGVETVGVGAQLGADLGDVLVSARRQHAGSGGGPGERDLLAEFGHLVFQTGEPGFDLVVCYPPLRMQT